MEANGLFGAPSITVVVGDEVHPSRIKALGMLGLGRSRVVRLPVDGQGRMLVTEMPPLSGPAIVCMQAGNVNTGAFGLWAAASPRYAHVIEGAADADSSATDAHKWLNVPYDSGLVFVRDAAALKSAMSETAAYLPQGGHREPSQYTPELSRRAAV